MMSVLPLWAVCSLETALLTLQLAAAWWVWRRWRETGWRFWSFMLTGWLALMGRRVLRLAILVTGLAPVLTWEALLALSFFATWMMARAAWEAKARADWLMARKARPEPSLAHLETLTARLAGGPMGNGDD